MPRLIRRLRHVSLLAVLVLALPPGVARAVSISAPATVQMPDSFDLVVTGTPWHSLSVYEGNADRAQFACLVQESGTCSFTVNAGYPAPETLTRTYRVVQDADGDSASTDVSFVQPPWNVQLQAAKDDRWEDPDAILKPGAANLTVQFSPKQWSPYRIRVFDADTGADTGISCATTDDVCSGTVDGGFRDALDASKHYVAKMMEGDTPVPGKPTSLATVNFYMPDFGLSISAPAYVGVNAPFAVAVKVSFYGWGSLHVTVRDSDGNVLGGCGMYDDPCNLTAWAAGNGWTRSYTAYVENAGQLIARAGPIQVTVIDPATAASVQGVSLAGVAAAYGSAQAICDAILPLPGTHNASSSATDQWLACDAAAQAGESGEASLRAIAGTLLGTTGLAYFAFLQHHAPTDTGSGPGGGGTGGGFPTDPDTGHVLPPVAVVPAAFDDLVQHLKDESPAIRDAADTEAARKIAYQCVEATGAANLPWQECMNESIFMPGSNIPEVTQSRREAIYFGRPANPAENRPALAPYPAWTQLTWKGGPRSRWHDKQPECETGYDTNVLHCDEYPYDRVMEGGYDGAQTHRPALKVLDRIQNVSEGGSLGQFRAPIHCDVQPGTKFLVLPLPPDLDVTTTYVCGTR